MEEEIDRRVLDFITNLFQLNQQIVEILNTSNLDLFTEMNKTIKQMFSLQHGSDLPEFVAVEEDCQVIYSNFDMIIRVLRTTEAGEIDRGAEKAINKFLHNIHEATVTVAKTFGLV